MGGADMAQLETGEIKRREIHNTDFENECTKIIRGTYGQQRRLAVR